ncbi:hypothetical protein GCM10020331_080550 [Ectobacillus funiculus]
MTVPFMKAYCLKVIQTCHRRNAPAMGGMAAQIPIKKMIRWRMSKHSKKVRADKEREATEGHDGTWVAHPGLVPVAIEVFNQAMATPNQIHVKRDDVHVTEEQLIEVPVGTITEQGLRTNINVGIQYIASWLCGRGAAPIYNLMEDAATAEISRAQVWQWVRHDDGKLEDGTKKLRSDLLSSCKRRKCGEFGKRSETRILRTGASKKRQSYSRNSYGMMNS